MDKVRERRWLLEPRRMLPLLLHLGADPRWRWRRPLACRGVVAALSHRRLRPYSKRLRDLWTLSNSNNDNDNANYSINIRSSSDDDDHHNNRRIRMIASPMSRVVSNSVFACSGTTGNENRNNVGGRRRRLA